MNIKEKGIEYKIANEISSAYQGNYNVAIYGDEEGNIIINSFRGTQQYYGDKFYYSLSGSQMNAKGNWEFDSLDELREMIAEKSFDNANEFLAQFESWLKN